MKELVFKVRKQEDGWYLASPVHEKIGGATEAQDYKTLKEKVKEFTQLLLSNGFYKEANLPENPQIRLIYSELLFENPEARKILITGNTENGAYRARTNAYVNLDLTNQDLDALREQTVREIQQQGHHDKHVEFKLEEVL